MKTRIKVGRRYIHSNHIISSPSIIDVTLSIRLEDKNSDDYINLEIDLEEAQVLQRRLNKFIQEKQS